MNPGLRELVSAPEFAVLATRDRDGTTHQCVMWVGLDGKDLVMASKRSRSQCRNIAADPRVSVLVYQRSMPQHYVHVRGTAIVTADGGTELIERLSRAYTGGPHGGGDENQRVVIRVTPERVRVR
jgi:PPOX class probable F420-dependent enzyme